jgi:RES domain-containing protein
LIPETEVDHDREIVRALAEISSSQWNGIVYRHMFADYRPDRENTLGARWNPPGIPAIYTSLSRETVLAEVEHQLSMEPLRPTVRRTLYSIEVALSSVLDLSSWAVLQTVGLSRENLADIDHAPCQRIGGAVEHLEHDGLLVPSARLMGGTNLVIYPNWQTSQYRFRVIDSEIIFSP